MKFRAIKFEFIVTAIIFGIVLLIVYCQVSKERNMAKKTCACDKQIVFFFEKPTIIVCEDCEVTLYYDADKCPHCGKKTTEFVKKE